MPALHCAITRRGVLTMNIGEQITGSVRLENMDGNFMMFPKKCSVRERLGGCVR